MRKLLWLLFISMFIAQLIIIYQNWAIRKDIEWSSKTYTKIEVVYVEKEEPQETTEVLETEQENTTETPVVEQENIIEMSLPDIEDNSFKAYMDYRTITDRTSVQWQMQQDAITDEYGFRKYDGRYMVAVGTYYATECGEIFNVEIDNGCVIECVVGDIKQDIHTDNNNQYAYVDDGIGNVLEFIVDTTVLCDNALIAGDVSYSIDELDGHIVHIYKIIEEVE